MALIDDGGWRGKLATRVMEAPKVAVVLVFFTGVFAVIAVDSLLRRRHPPVVAKRQRLRQ